LQQQQQNSAERVIMSDIFEVIISFFLNVDAKRRKKEIENEQGPAIKIMMNKKGN
jgi:hypothetical protein